MHTNKYKAEYDSYHKYRCINYTSVAMIKTRATYSRYLGLQIQRAGVHDHGVEAAGNRHSGWSRKLRAHILNHDTSIESELTMVQVFKLSKPAPSDTFPLANPHLPNCPNNVSKWGPSI